ncbi:hypothetical protein DFH07DRAFT_833372 [Mycena maculata]|uniref:Uncharacterized protein n=1 Tax=Mycena maculata TaxID=230809 RepID=A0AAD7N4T0_9AGAR|nr:hypothetical protein DFH07DRAFT_833372 [Mycena maculata]
MPIRPRVPSVVPLSAIRIVAAAVLPIFLVLVLGARGPKQAPPRWCWCWSVNCGQHGSLGRVSFSSYRRPINSACKQIRGRCISFVSNRA